MEQLPTDIEQKIENLPIIALDAGDEFQNLIFSQEFTDIFNFYKENYLPDVLKSKSEIYQRISLYLTLTNQDTSFIAQTDNVLYRRPCPTIEEFLDNKFYMGYSNATLYPYWKEQLKLMFKEGSPVRKVIFSGCLGCGKSTVARKAFLYVLYRIMCLRYPRSTFNVDADATIANVVIATTLKQVYDVNMLPFVKLMETMPCFQRVMSQRSFENFNLDDPHCPIPFVLEKSSGTVYFPDNIILTSGSQATHFTGMNVVNSFCFTGNMKVYTDKGIISFISLLRQFKKGIKFNTYCLDRNGIKQKVKILDVQETRKVTELIRIYYDDERYIECTPDHPFIINNPKKEDKYIIYENGIAYKQAQYLTEEDDIASEKQAYVYALIDNRQTSKTYNLPFYIGISTHENTLNNRFDLQYTRPFSHFTNKSLKQDHNKIKSNIIKDILSQKLKPEIQILKTNISLSEAYDLEKQLMQQYRKIIDHTGILTNISNGGEGVILITPEIINKKSTKIKETKYKQKQQKIQDILNWLCDIKHLYYIWLIQEGHRLQVKRNRTQAALQPNRRLTSKNTLCTYNKSEKHRKRTSELNHLFPKVSSKESRIKLAKSQSLSWNKKTIEEKTKANIAKSLGRAWNVLKRIKNDKINEQIFNSHRSTGLRLANTEPLWKTIIAKVGGIEAFLLQIEKQFGRKFIYED